MAVAESHSPPGDGLSSSSSPDYAASCFTPESSGGSSSRSRGREEHGSQQQQQQEEEGENENDDKDGYSYGEERTRRRGPVDHRLSARLEKTTDGFEAYELRELGGPINYDEVEVEEDDDDNDDKGVDEPDIDDLEDREGLVYTAEEERAVVRKFDRRLVLFVALLYMLSFLDRSNIGNAYTAGMDEDLLQTTDPVGAKHGSSPDYYYEWALTVFYLAYIAFEWLSLLWTVVPAHVYVSALVLSWGAVASLQAVAGSYPWLIRLRFLLGVGEAGFTSIPIYLSFFFRREELALRTAIFISAAPLATTFASSLAWVIIRLGENGPIAPWRLLFLLEGFPAVIVATLAWRIIPDSPEKAWYLTKREKRIARQRLLAAATPGHKTSRNATKKEDDDDDDDDMDSDWTTRCCQSTLAVLLDPVPWTTAAIFFLTNVAYSSLPVFLPSILTQMGHSPLAAQALAAPPYLVSFVVVLAVAAASDALRSRAYLITASALASAAGYAFLAMSETINGGGDGGGTGMLNMARYLAIYPAAAGFFCVVVLTISWNVNNARGAGAGHKGGGFALMQVIGQCGPLVGTRLYPRTDGPWFTKGMGICAGAMLGVAGLAVALRWHLARRNRRWDQEEGNGDGDAEEEEGLVDGGSSDGGSRRGHGGVEVGFRYML